jgi:FkbM family methyltransferase
MTTFRSKFKSVILSALFLPYRVNWYLILVQKFLYNKVKKNLGTSLLDSYVSLNESRKLKIVHRTKNGDVFRSKIYVPNYICSYRVRSFSTKEPETLEWIDEFGGEGAFFDIGANIGLYSIYYASTKSEPVYAFEPSFLNTKQLVKNISLNELSNLINIISTPLSSANEIANFNLSSVHEGGALSSFGVTYGQDGIEFEEQLQYRTMGFTLDTLVDLGLIPNNPSLVKVDVDGIEDLILMGAIKTLGNPKCKSVLVEVTPKFTKQINAVGDTLRKVGFELRENRTQSSQDGYNQIWTRH